MPVDVWRYVLSVDGRDIELSDGEVTLGRSRTSTVRVDHESVSRSHALITFERGQAVVKDLNSSNGTYVGGRRVLNETRLMDGDRIQLGAAVISYKLIAPSVAPERTALIDQDAAAAAAAAPPPAAPVSKPIPVVVAAPPPAAPPPAPEPPSAPPDLSALFRDVDAQDRTGKEVPRIGDANAAIEAVKAAAPPPAPAPAPAPAPPPPPAPVPMSPAALRKSLDPPSRTEPMSSTMEKAMQPPAPYAPAALQAPVAPPPPPVPAPLAPAPPPPAPMAAPAPAPPRPVPPRPQPPPVTVRAGEQTLSQVPLEVGGSAFDAFASATSGVPQNVAGFFPRLLAALVDNIILSAIDLLFLSPVFLYLFFRGGLAGKEGGPDLALIGLSALCFLLMLSANIWYVIGGWAKSGRTPGKSLTGLKIVTGSSNAGLGIAIASSRALFMVLSAIPFGLGFLVVLFRKDKRAWHDLLAGTWVVKTR